MNEPLQLILPIMAGTLLLFLGWGLYKTSLKILGFLIGCALGVAVSYLPLSLLASQQPEIETYLPWIVGFVAIVLGLINARLFMKIYYLVVFLVGAFYGAALKMSLLDQWPEAVRWVDRLGSIGQSPWGEILAALVFGLICVLLHKYLVILLTCLIGSALIVIPVDSLLNVRIYWAFPILIGIGLISQFGLLRVFSVRPRGREQAAK